MAPTRDQLVTWRGLWSAVASGEKVDDFLLPGSVGLIQHGLFPNLWQQNRGDQIMFEAQDVGRGGNIQPNCRVPGSETLTNRAYINELVEAYATAYPDERDRVEQFQLEWNGRVEDEDRPDKNFNNGELRNIREFIKYLANNGRTEWFDRLVPAEVASLGDLRLISNVNKATDSQSRYQTSLRNGIEFKDPADLSPHSGASKGGWSEIGGYANDIAETIKNGQKVRDAQKDRIADLPKELENARKAAKHFRAENAAVQNRTFNWAVQHGDLDEYIRLSPNYNSSLGWVVNPFGRVVREDGQQVVRAPAGDRELTLHREIERRIQHLENDQLTREVAARTDRTNRQIAELRELFFRGRDLVDRLAGVHDPERGWNVAWMDAWDNLTEGFALIDLVVTPSTPIQRTEAVVDDLHQVVRNIALAKLDLPGKYDLPLLTFAFFVVAVGFWLVVSLGLTGNSNSNWVPAVLLGLVSAWIFHGMLNRVAVQYRRTPFYLLMGFVFILVAIVVVASNIQSDMITDELRQRQDAFDRALGIK
jgi:hypothetical protein